MFLMQLLISGLRLSAPAVLLSALGLACAPVVKAADTGEKLLYQWDDDAGETHFSDKPPSEKVPDVQILPMNPGPPPTSDAPEDDYYSVENQARRMEEDRRAREAERDAAEMRDQERIVRESDKAAGEPVRDEGQPVLVRPAYPIVPPQHLPVPKGAPFPGHIGRPGGNIAR